MPDRPSAPPQARKLGLKPGQRVALASRIYPVGGLWGLRLVWRVANRAGPTAEGAGP